MNVADDYTSTLCANDTQAMVTARALLALERKVHDAGWDGPLSDPTIFDVTEKGLKRQVNVSQILTRMLQFTLNVNDSYLPGAMEALARSAELALDPTTIDQLIENGAPPWVIEEGRRAYTELNAGRDAAFDYGGPGWRLYGYGYCAEAWKLVSDDHDAVEQARRTRTVHLHPDRIEIRTAMLTGRDGLVWYVERERGKPATVQAVKPDGDHGPVGAIPHCLSRMTNAAVGNPVPIWPA